MMKVSAYAASILMVLGAYGLTTTQAIADDPEYSLNDLVRIINDINQDLPKNINGVVTIERVVQGAGRQIIYIYAVPTKDAEMTDKQRKDIRAKVLDGLCTDTATLVKDGVAVSARTFSSDRRQIIAVTANKATCPQQ